MVWNLFDARTCFHSSRDRWDTINRENDNHVLLDFQFWQPLIKYFASGHVYLAINDSNLGKGVALIEATRRGVWRTFQPSQAPLGPILFDRLAATAWRKYISALMSDLPGYAMAFSATQQDPDFSCFNNINDELSSETLDYIKTPRLRIVGSYDEYWKSRSRNLTHNLSRQHRRLKDQGTVLELIADRDAESVSKGVEEYGRLESTGWKGKEGTAVAIDNAQGRFYRELLEDFCCRGEGIIYRLLIDGKTVASDLCLERNESLVILKTAYDESVQGLSLGLLLHEEIFRSLFQHGTIKIVEFYGPLKEWHTKWTSEARTMYHINFYRHRWMGTVRQWLKNVVPNKGVS